MPISSAESRPGQYGFRILDLGFPTSSIIEPIPWCPRAPEPISPDTQGYHQVPLSVIPDLAEKIVAIENGVGWVTITPEELLAREEGTQLHQLYALVRCIQLGGTPETLPYYFPTLKPDSAEMRWMQETIIDKDPLGIWQRVMLKADLDLRAMQPLLIRPESGINFDQLYSLWQASDCYQRGCRLLNRMALFSRLIPHETEETADKIYFETWGTLFYPRLTFKNYLSV
jgi:hypothetical protein